MKKIRAISLRLNSDMQTYRKEIQATLKDVEYILSKPEDWALSRENREALTNISSALNDAIFYLEELLKIRTAIDKATSGNYLDVDKMAQVGRNRYFKIDEHGELVETDKDPDATEPELSCILQWKLIQRTAQLEAEMWHDDLEYKLRKDGLETDYEQKTGIFRP